MKLSFKDINDQIKEKLPVKETEAKANEMYKTLVSYFEDRLNRIEGRIEDAGIIKRETSKTGIVVGTLAGLAVGAIAALKLPLDDINIPKVKDIKIPVRETGEKVNNLYHNLAHFFQNRMHNVEGRMEDVGIIEKKNTGPGIFLGALAGLAVGSAAALLLAQDSGEEFREKVVKNYNKTKDQLFEKKDEKSQYAKNEAENVKNAASAQTKDFTHKRSI